MWLIVIIIIFYVSSSQIDAFAIQDIDDESLARYIPAYGDRIATRRYCMDKQRKKAEETSKMSLLDKLRQKMRTTSTNRAGAYEPGASSVGPRRFTLRNALKTTRKIELGWIHDGKQVRKRCGGGTRLLDVNKTATKMDLLFHAKELFFPEGKSKKGNWEDFIHNVYDFKECELDDHTDVGELYTLSKFGILRFYLHTAARPQEADTEDNSDLSNTPNEQQEQISHTLQQQDLSNIQTGPPSTVECGRRIHFENSSNEIVDLRSPSPILDSEVLLGPGQGTPSETQLDDTLPVLPNINSPLTSAFLHPPDDITTPRHASTPLPDAFDAHRTHTAPVYDIENELDYEILSVQIQLHRVNLLDEMICQFKDPLILNYPLKYSLVNESGRDEDGVARDVYTGFWNDFLDRAAEGAELRIPALSPKWQEDEWRAVGRILVKGYMDQGYFPLRLAPAFTTALLFGEHAVSSNVLFESLRMYLSQSERDLIDLALEEDLDGEAQDELLDMLDRLGVKIIPKRENLKAVLLQVAHKQIIQEPKYALDNMAAVAAECLKTTIKTPEQLQAMYMEKKPTCRKVLKLLEAHPASPPEKQAFKFFQQYICVLDETGLRKVLRFITGSDIISVSRIEVLFTNLEGLSRRPVAHTCGAVLELPFTYNSYPELRMEMEMVLSSNYLQMDIM